jgi:hypothetical protein
MDDRGANAKRFGTLTKPLPVASKKRASIEVDNHTAGHDRNAHLADER